MVCGLISCLKESKLPECGVECSWFVDEGSLVAARLQKERCVTESKVAIISSESGSVAVLRLEFD